MSSKKNSIISNKREILKILSNSKYVTIIGHRNPDVDCIGSCLALSLLIKKVFKKKAFVINTDKKNRDLNNLLLIDNVIFEVTEETLPKKDILVVLDSGDIDRIGWVADIANEYNEVIFIDHHKVRNLKNVTKFLNNTEAAATCEMIFDIFSSYQSSIDSNISTLLYCGLITDTGGFTFTNTTEHTLLVASKLMSRGVKIDKIGNATRRRYRNIDIEVLKVIYDKIVIDEDNKIGYLCIDDNINGYSLKDISVSPSDVLLQMENVNIGFIVHNNEDNFRVSIRSRCEKNIRSIAESFGGGGHLKASGFTVSKIDYNLDSLVADIKNKILKLLSK